MGDNPGRNLASGMLVRTLFGYSVFNFVLLSPILIDEFLITATGIGAIMAVYWVPALTLPLFIGRLADRIGEKTIVVLGCLVVALGAFIFSQAITFEFLLIGRFISGFGAILFWTTGINLVIKLYKEKQISLVTSLIVLCYGVGTLLAMVLAPIQQASLGWRYVFLITSLYGVGVAIFVALLSRNPPVYQNSRCAVRKVIKNKDILKIAIAQSFSVGAWTSFLTFFSLSLQYEGGVDVFFANFTLILASLSGIIFALVGGFLADRKYQRKFWIFSPLFGLSLLFFLINPLSGINIIVDLFLAFIVGALIWIPQGSIWSLPKIIEPNCPNIAMGVLVTFTAIAGTLFPLTFGFLVDLTAAFFFSFIFLGFMVLFAALAGYKITKI
ncbi:MAG: MFS transporter [Candidatus Odinarchaeia archaeon]